MGNGLNTFETAARPVSDSRSNGRITHEQRYKVFGTEMQFLLRLYCIITYSMMGLGMHLSSLGQEI